MVKPSAASQRVAPWPRASGRYTRNRVDSPSTARTEADGARRAGLVEHDQRRPVTLGRVGDLQPVRLDHRHRAAMLPPGRIAHRPTAIARTRRPSCGSGCYDRRVSDDPSATGPATRIERDSMGEMAVPADALYGASTQRAVLNFPISGERFPRRFIRALALIKLAAAETNGALGLLDADVADAIAAAAQDVADGGYDDQFPIDIYQTGSGTSTNTNMNEVVAHLAAARLGGGRTVHPNDDVNRCQSSNDTIPTALQLSAAMAIEEALLPGLERLHTALVAKEQELWPVVKTGRTHLQDATPIRLGQEFRGYAGQVEESIRRAKAAQAELLSVPLGGTAVGTGINAHPEYALRACARLSAADRAGRPRDHATTSTPSRRSTRRSRRTARSGRSR